jgi:hypothetical protein
MKLKKNTVYLYFISHNFLKYPSGYSTGLFNVKFPRDGLE